MKQSDFLVIGSGIAGLIYALDVCKYGKVLVICKNDPLEGNTRYAQGGIASVMTREDSFESHVRDTLEAGAGLCKKDIVELVVSEGPEVIQRLSEIGTGFDLEQNGLFSLGKEGGHSARRILHSGDTTGAEIQRALNQKVLSEKNIELLPYHLAIDFIRSDEVNPDAHTTAPYICGCYALNLKTGQVETISGKLSMLASGGLGKVYLYTSNPDVATGDGVAMAYRAGAEIRNMEFIQFHPTCLHHPYAKNFLITEAMRGEGAKLLRKDGTRFMNQYHTDGELAPRDIVARAIDSELKASGDDHVLLDIHHLEESFLKKRFPAIYKHLLEFGIDISKQAIPVVPAAHYSCGGVTTNAYGRTSLPRLYAAGEVACTGLHGANRLASNSLLEAVVFGRRAAIDSIKEIENCTVHSSLPRWDTLGTRNSKEQILVRHVWEETRRTMSNLVGIVRSESRLLLAKKRIETSLEEIESYYWSYQITGDLIELRNITLVAKLIIDSALSRKESRGLHFIEEYPEKNPAMDEVDSILPGR
jgi:L-aspartate oxidase